MNVFRINIFLAKSFINFVLEVANSWKSELDFCYLKVEYFLILIIAELILSVACTCVSLYYLNMREFSSTCI